MLFCRKVLDSYRNLRKYNDSHLQARASPVEVDATRQEARKEKGRKQGLAWAKQVELDTEKKKKLPFKLGMKSPADKKRTVFTKLKKHTRVSVCRLSKKDKSRMRSTVGST